MICFLGAVACALISVTWLGSTAVPFILSDVERNVYKALSLIFFIVGMLLAQQSVVK
jgi:hypothetical protein